MDKKLSKSERDSLQEEKVRKFCLRHISIIHNIIKTSRNIRICVYKQRA